MELLPRPPLLMKADGLVPMLYMVMTGLVERLTF